MRRELVESSLYGFLDYCVRDLLALIIGKAVVQPIVADRGAKSCLGSYEEFVTRPIGKGANGQKFCFCTIAIS
jgi:hypothetical protein